VKRASKRFEPNNLTRYAVPAVIGLIFLSLLAALVLIALAVLGVMPAG
jgi:hypothetical protein